ncbi:predicted protein [Uncinocarpus reesii 1704]|uniref:Protein kinase domain-containing protein n=1 Tax=Uncinocarpus reesii (strain UAMH 1704) TaxID=336963 RepID=C4JVQ0_UNCRE|nr:uncharacterized protein UREG_06642 [Uncinocarpus reesii 1704]EEP81777.1 predicted protein [Uncinocarpus reesii 1704]
MADAWHGYPPMQQQLVTSSSQLLSHFKDGSSETEEFKQNKKQPQQEEALNQMANSVFGEGNLLRFGSQNRIRPLYDTFEASGPNGKHTCLVHPPMHITLLGFMQRLPNRRLDKHILRLTVKYLLNALDFLHTEAKVVHTGQFAIHGYMFETNRANKTQDLKADNIMLSVADKSVLDDYVNTEVNDPSPRKIVDDVRTIYTSRPLRTPADSNWGPPFLCDFGEARIGETHRMKALGDTQPHVYRAPEVTFRMTWGPSIDIWNFANLVWLPGLRYFGLYPTNSPQIWDLLEPDRLFPNIHRGKVYCPYKHMAKIVSVLGPPPKVFISRSEDTHNCFDSEGNWTPKEAEEIPSYRLEDSETALEGRERDLFLQFIRSMLTWLPEHRKTAKELLDDPWLNNKID